MLYMFGVLSYRASPHWSWYLNVTQITQIEGRVAKGEATQLQVDLWEPISSNI